MGSFLHSEVLCWFKSVIPAQLIVLCWDNLTSNQFRQKVESQLSGLSVKPGNWTNFSPDAIGEQNCPRLDLFVAGPWVLAGFLREQMPAVHDQCVHASPHVLHPASLRGWLDKPPGASRELR